jgi:hypothetical protein
MKMVVFAMAIHALGKQVPPGNTVCQDDVRMRTRVDVTAAITDGTDH